MILFFIKSTHLYLHLLGLPLIVLDVTNLLETGRHLAREELSATNPEDDLFDLSLYALKTTNPEEDLLDLSLYALGATNPEDDLFDLSLSALETKNPEDDLLDLSLYALKTTNPEEDLLDLSLFALGATNPEGAVLDLSRCIAKRLVYNKSLFISAVNGINQIVRGYVQNYVLICHFGNVLRFLAGAAKTPSA